MSGALSHPLVKRIVAYQAAMAQQDFHEAREIFAPDVVYSVPGSNVLSGLHVGPDAVMAYFARLMQMTGGTYGVSDMLWLVNDCKVMLTTRNHATIQGASLSWTEAIAFEFEGRRKKRIELFQADQGAVDAFYSRAS